MDTILQSKLDADDAWIDAIPDDTYAPCPCGCKMKWKFAKQEVAKHEQAFYQKFLAEQGVVNA